MNLNRVLPPYSASTIAGLAILAGSVSSWLLGAATAKQAAAAAISGVVAVVAKQSGVTLEGGA